MTTPRRLSLVRPGAADAAAPTPSAIERITLDAQIGRVVDALNTRRPPVRAIDPMARMALLLAEILQNAAMQSPGMVLFSCAELAASALWLVPLSAETSLRGALDLRRSTSTAAHLARALGYLAAVWIDDHHNDPDGAPPDDDADLEADHALYERLRDAATELACEATRYAVAYVLDRGQP